MAFLDEQGLQRLADKINVRASSTLPNNAPDGTIIINPDEDTEIFNVDNINIDVDSALSLTSTNPVQNKVVTKELERIPYKLTIECVGFDGNEVNPGNIATGEIQLSLNEDKDYDTMDTDSISSRLTLIESYSLRKKIEKAVYNNTPYNIHVFQNRGIIPIGEYYEPDETGFTGVITGDTNIVITFKKKREPVTLKINLKDKNGNFVCDDVSVIDGFDLLRKEKIVGTYGKIADSFTVQVTKGYDYEIKPLLKGFNNKEKNSPADPDKTIISGTANNDETIDIVYSKTYPQDYSTDWASFHEQIAANPGTEVLPIGTELIAHNDQMGQVKFHIVNWRYAEKEDGSQVWGCDLLAVKMVELPISFYEKSGASNGWEGSYIRSFSERFATVFDKAFSSNVQKIKVISSVTKDTPVYTYDTMWLPSATEMYIDTNNSTVSDKFTKVVEGNSNEKYWKTIRNASSKFVPTAQNKELIFTGIFLNEQTSQEQEENAPYWLRSCSLSVDGTDGEYRFTNSVWTVREDGTIENQVGTNTAAVRPMLFFA